MLIYVVYQNAVLVVATALTQCGEEYLLATLAVAHLPGNKGSTWMPSAFQVQMA